MRNQSGQIILGLILVMVVALGIGLAVVQKSLVDVSTSSKVEQSSRAFSAAEAGIEKALSGDLSGVNFTTDNNSKTKNPGIGTSPSSSDTTVYSSGPIPCVPGQTGCDQGAGTRQAALEFPPLAKEDTTQIWLSDPNCSLVSIASCKFYSQQYLDFYWGNADSKSDLPGLEVTIIYYDGTAFQAQKWYLDRQILPDDSQNRQNNGFTPVTCLDKNSVDANHKIGNDPYQCLKEIDLSSKIPNFSNSILFLARIRLLYNSTSQPFAIQAVRGSSCPSERDCALPPQARILVSTGISGDTQRRVKVFQINNVVPSYLDYAIFSAGDITKSKGTSQ